MSDPKYRKPIPEDISTKLTDEDVESEMLKMDMLLQAKSTRKIPFYADRFNQEEQPIKKSKKWWEFWK